MADNMKICHGCSVIVAVVHWPSTCGSRSMKVQTSATWAGENAKVTLLRLFACCRMATKRRHAFCVQLPPTMRPFRTSATYPSAMAA